MVPELLGMRHQELTGEGAATSHSKNTRSLMLQFDENGNSHFRELSRSDVMNIVLAASKEADLRSQAMAQESGQLEKGGE